MSVELQNLRSELLREALLKGWTRAADVPEPWSTQLPRERIERWYRKLYRAPEAPTPVGQRLINHFMLGADPEFVFHNASSRIDARQLNLRAGPAFGADNNGRLCELRPAPSRSALSVLASLWLAMRWMAVYHPQVLGYNWRSGGYYEGDGLGGHVHFGRKRLKLRERETQVLDRITHLLFVAAIFDREEGRLRVRQSQGAGTGQTYGNLGDVRRQPHGWEYRTLPSWIDNPWLAYFNLVLSKLVVALPDMVAPLTQMDANLGTEQARQQLQMLLAYYQATDDDARLALAILTRRGFPTHAQGLDFKSSWGLFPAGPLGSKPECRPPDVLPESVPSRPEDELELALSMFENRAPEFTELRPTWQHPALPQGYVHSIKGVDTKLAPGLGEWAMPLCHSKDMPVHLVNCGHRPQAFRFPVSLSQQISRSQLLPKLQALGLQADVASEEWTLYMNASKDYELAQLFRARDVIVDSQVLPIWRVSEVQKDSYAKWRALYERLPQGPKTLFEGQGL